MGGQSQDYSDETAKAIDDEIKLVIDSCYMEATKILTKNLKLTAY